MSNRYGGWQAGTCRSPNPAVQIRPALVGSIPATGAGVRRRSAPSSRPFRSAMNIRPRCRHRGLLICQMRRLSPRSAQKAKQHQEQVDEIEVELQRAEDGLLAGKRAVVRGGVTLLDPLRIVGGEPREDENA